MNVNVNKMKMDSKDKRLRVSDDSRSIGSSSSFHFSDLDVTVKCFFGEIVINRAIVLISIPQDTSGWLWLAPGGT